MKKILENEEREIRELIAQLSDRADRASSEFKKGAYNKLLEELKIRAYEISDFKKTVGQNGRNHLQTSNLRRLFHTANEVLFAGFDYYYASNIVEKLAAGKDLSQEVPSINVLINEEHLEALKRSVDCYKKIDIKHFLNYEVIEDEYKLQELSERVALYNKLDFISYENNGSDRIAIWLRSTPCRLNLIPFKRESKDKIRLENGDLMTIDSDNSAVKEYNGLGYRTLQCSDVELSHEPVVSHSTDDDKANEYRRQALGFRFRNRK